MAKKTLQERYEKIRDMKEGEVARRQFEYERTCGAMYACDRGANCPACPAHEVTCQGCDAEHAKHCMAKICNGICSYNQWESNLGYCLYDRCSRIPPEWMEKWDHQELGTYAIQEIIDKIKPTNPLNLGTTYIPVIQPYGKLAPGEIVRTPEAHINFDDISNGVCMIPANQLPLWTQDVENYSFQLDAEKIHLGDLDLFEWLGITKDTSIILNFRVQDMLLAHFWTRYLYDRKHKIKNTLFGELKKRGIEFSVSCNFSMYDGFPLWHNYYNLMRTLISFVELQKYFGKQMILELNTNPVSQQVDDWLVKAVNEGGVATVHHNFQITSTGEIQWATMRHRLHEKLECEEIILGGVGNFKQIMKYATVMKDKYIYLANTRAYLTTVFRQHANGSKWGKPIPPEEDTEGRAFYYAELFKDSTKWLNNEAERLLKQR